MLKTLHLTLASLFVVAALASSMAFAAPEGTVNINTANAQELATMLDGIGSSRAAAIVTYRETHGDFESVEELTAVRGIGTQVLQSNRSKIVLRD